MDTLEIAVLNLYLSARDFLQGVANKVRRLRTKYSHCGEIVKQLERLTLTQLVRFVRVCHDKYQRAIIEPGTAVGALAAQVYIYLYHRACSL